MIRTRISFCSFLVIFAQTSLQCKILVTTDGFSTSHVMFHYRIAETLAENGFDVTFLHPQTKSDVVIKVRKHFIAIIRFKLEIF